MNLRSWFSYHPKPVSLKNRLIMFMKIILLIIIDNDVLFFFAGKTRGIKRKLELELIQGCFQLYSL